MPISAFIACQTLITRICSLPTTQSIWHWWLYYIIEPENVENHVTQQFDKLTQATHVNVGLSWEVNVLTNVKNKLNIMIVATAIMIIIITMIMTCSWSSCYWLLRWRFFLKPRVQFLFYCCCFVFVCVCLFFQKSAA